MLTFAIYQVSLYELPPLAQFLLLAALALVLFPAETGEDLPWWSTAWVAAVTLVLVTWWSRQRTTRTGAWKIPLLLIYAFALVGFTTQAVRPWFDAQGWMVIAAFLSLGFLIYGAFTRTWRLRRRVNSSSSSRSIISSFRPARPSPGHGGRRRCRSS